MSFLKTLFSRDVVEETDEQKIESVISNGVQTFLIPSVTEEQPHRKTLGRITDSEGRPWEVSAAPNAVWLYNVEDNEYVFYDALGASEFLDLIAQAVEHAHLA